MLSWLASFPPWRKAHSNNTNPTGSQQFAGGFNTATRPGGPMQTIPSAFPYGPYMAYGPSSYPWAGYPFSMCKTYMQMQADLINNTVDSLPLAVLPSSSNGQYPYPLPPQGAIYGFPPFANSLAGWPQNMNPAFSHLTSNSASLPDSADSLHATPVQHLPEG
ncbi:hypothetical protein GYMLUDRAFT_55720 [Collybiopsis luxurians FD-317 M1]|nr:hypothetical protein GYMLUDRAFT_55720 [Collybiopsis luxurians FD-317 M1]